MKSLKFSNSVLDCGSLFFGILGKMLPQIVLNSCNCKEMIRIFRNELIFKVILDNSLKRLYIV